MMTDQHIKQALSDYLHKFGEQYDSWYPEFFRLKSLAEQEGQTIQEYYKDHIMPELHPKKEKPKKKAFVPPDPIKEIIAEIPFTPEERAILIAEKEARLKALQPEEEDEFPCPHCEKVYTVETSLKRHITMKHPEGT